MIRRPPRSTQSRSSAASDVYKRQVLRDRIVSDGVEVASKFFDLRLDDDTLAISDAVGPLFSLTDNDSWSHLRVAADGTFVSPYGSRTLSVTSGAEAASRIASGALGEATLTLEPCPNCDSTLTFTGADGDCKLSASGRRAIFEVTLMGNAPEPIFDISDGSDPLLRITDVGDVADLLLSGTLASQGFTTPASALIGSTRCHPTYCPFPYDSIKLGGHLTQDMFFDSHMDGHTFTLRFEDPSAQNTVITIPDVSAEVLTNVSTFSVLTSVGDLHSGAIDWTGKITSSGDVSSVGTRTSGSCTGVADPISFPIPGWITRQYPAGHPLEHQTYMWYGETRLSYRKSKMLY